MAAASAPRRKSSPRLTDIAQQAGVGIATVNRVLNERGSTSVGTREKVIRAAKQLGAKRQLPDVRSGLTRFDVVMARSRTPFFRRMELALERIMQLLDRRIVVHRHEFASQDEARTAAFIQHPPHRRDGLIVALHDTPLLREAVRAVSLQGVPVVTLMSDISDVPRLHYAGIDNLHAGRTAGHFMGRLVRQPGRVLVLTNDLAYRAHRDRTSGFMGVMAERCSHLHCLPVQACLDDPDKTFAAVDTALRLEAELPLVGLYHSGAGSAGIVQALRRHGQDGQVVWVGHELSDEHRESLVQGQMDLVIDQDPDGQMLSGMQHLLFVNKWLDQMPPTGPNEFRLFCAENLPSQPYLPAAAAAGSAAGVMVER